MAMMPEEAPAVAPEPRPPPQEQRPASLLRELFAKNRVYMWIGIFAIELVIFFSAIAYPLDPASQKAALEQAKNTLGNEGTLGPTGLFSLIFSNNTRIALLEMTPGLGGLLFVFSIVTTGEVIQALAVSVGQPGLLYGFFLFLFPFSILELGAYAMAFSSGIMVFVALFRRRLRAELRVFVAEAAVIVGVLCLAAAMETLTIVAPGVGFALWIPVGVGIGLAVVRLRRAWDWKQSS